MRHRLLHALALALLACGPGEPNTESIPADQVEYCVETFCHKPLGCHGAIEPSDDWEARCWQNCTRLFEQSAEHDCDAEFQALLDCTDAAECDPYLEWFFDYPDAVCTTEEQQLLDACPELQFREP